ncbi:hypothetical protein ACLKA7_000323 [Drosophila subpalustris]
MSAKTSPSNSRDANVTGAANVGAPNVAGGVVQIKKELPSDEIKEFAQHTMNELLGWYGFDGVDVDRLDLTAKTSRLLQSAAAAAVATQQQQQQQQQQQLQQQQQQRNNHLRSSRSSLAATYHNNNNNNNNSNNNSNTNNNNNISNNNNRSKSSNLNCHSNTTTPSDHDTRSSREDDSKSPHSIGKPAASSLLASQAEEKIDYNNCCWCHRPIAENAPDYLTSTDGPRYCSESCFTQSRRASFKKAKTCDWCKHVRHAVSYVDFQDGASQLQFCSEKCLNQYKMQIFCNETQAHLDMNPHLRDQGLEAADGAALITPDLWLRNCRSRSASPASTISVSPGPGPGAGSTAVSCKRSSPCHSPPNPTQPNKPLISVAPVSKLLAHKSPASSASCAGPVPPPLQRHHSKPGRRKRPHRAAAPTGVETVANLLQKQQQPPVTLSADLAGSSVPLAPLSPLQEQLQQPQQQSQPQQQQPPQLGRPPGYFATQPNGVLGHPFGARAPPPHPFLPPPGMPGMLPRGFGGHFGPLPPMQRPQMPPQMPQISELPGALGALLGAAPPVTVMVPYPIIIPLPIPIPVPLPIVDFYKAHLTPEQRKRFDQERARGAGEDQAQPLDCSKAKTEAEMETEIEMEMEMDMEMETETEQVLEQNQEQEQETAQEEHEEHQKSKPKTAPPSPATSTTPTTDSPGQTTHCIIVHKVEETEATTNPGHDSVELEAQKLPKIKITRLQTKRTSTQTKDTATTTPTSPTGGGGGVGGGGATSAAAECSRPLRKRKRIIDCDFQKIALRELEAAEDNNNKSNKDTQAETETEVCNINSNNSAKAKK